MADRYEEALKANEQALLLMPDFPFGLKDLVIYNEKLGRRADALEALAKFKASWPGVTLEHVERMHKGSVLAPEIADQYQDLFAAAWHAAGDADGAG